MTARRRGRRLPQWARWLHTYVSLLGFAALVFFSVTGITLNHAGWWEGVVTEREVDGVFDTEVLPGSDGPVRALAVVEWLRAHEGLRGAVAEFGDYGDEIVVSFQGPGYAADVSVDRATGAYELLETRRGAVAIANDLHKGRHSGPAWSWLIDATAVVLTLAGLTGIWLLLYLRKIRWQGLATAGVGTLLVVLTWAWGVA